MVYFLPHFPGKCEAYCIVWLPMKTVLFLLQNFTQITAHLSKGEKCFREMDRAYCWSYCMCLDWSPVSGYSVQFLVEWMNRRAVYLSFAYQNVCSWKVGRYFLFSSPIWIWCLAEAYGGSNMTENQSNQSIYSYIYIWLFFVCGGCEHNFNIKWSTLRKHGPH